VSRFTRPAILKAASYKARTGTLWAADETVLDVAGGRTKVGADNTIWFWDVIDEKTRFLLASHMSRTRTIKDAELLFTQANGRSLVVPKHIVTDKLGAYLDGIERVFGSDTIHVQSQGMASSTHNNYIERFHGTLKQRTKVMRRLKSPTTAKIVLDGWLIHYNYFRPHEGLRGLTPAEAAGIRFPYKSWQDIIDSLVESPV
jgi:transposase-like protein